MKKKDLMELKNKNIEEIQKKIDQLVSEIVVNKLELKMGKLKNVHLISKKKKDLARLETILKLKYFAIKPNMSEKKVKKNVTS
ncbi:50S ribosomal protein L29 [Candidatus Curtissbacteria bacterium RIFCSPLOWO2_02_FULL_40_13b]|uniref:Large ribosomal subunit protein uL29 n=1 Tax=Candidatus Curtissbacteria bacterium RIFCSPLOWO2_02_FULL_40_13b TaxID=1797733 RepID=A0A1F5HVE0_9BACT|nr:MAG: 50S ribosomal protein L29 [Candidatus Curtissbacteria bacterium RIFCSPLOWO2_02_FULL_40_13b]